MHLFSALLGFADPKLELHLRGLGMQPDAYASDWLSEQSERSDPDPDKKAMLRM